MASDLDPCVADMNVSITISHLPFSSLLAKKKKKKKETYSSGKIDRTEQDHSIRFHRSGH
jgi:hypothetical protein